MAIRIRHGQCDEIMESIIKGLRAYEADHPAAEIELYRQNSVSVRVRIIDPTFAGQDRVDRSEKVWKYFDVVPDEPLSDLSMLTLLTPEETARSISNMEFEDPVPATFL